VDDLVALRDLRLANLAGIISGKALYEHKLTIADAHEVLDSTRERAA
jgi:phosphoribosylformimino-5-aminoimidazole carboxamide ribonucleotide (ProFAR) isomerase